MRITCSSVWPRLSVSLIRKLNSPATVGMPEIGSVPEVEDPNVRPGAGAAKVSAHVNGPTPYFA